MAADCVDLGAQLAQQVAALSCMYVLAATDLLASLLAAFLRAQVGYDQELSAAMKYVFGGSFICKVHSFFSMGLPGRILRHDRAGLQVHSQLQHAATCGVPIRRPRLHLPTQPTCPCLALTRHTGRRYCQEAGLCSGGVHALHHSGGRRLQPRRHAHRRLPQQGQLGAGEGQGCQLWGAFPLVAQTGLGSLLLARQASSWSAAVHHARGRLCAFRPSRCHTPTQTCLTTFARTLQARLHELAQAEEGLAAAQAAFNQAHASLQAMAAAAQQYKK